MKRTFTYLILLAPLWGGAQMLNTSAPLDLQSWHQFDPAFLAAGDIDTIEVRLQTKRDGRPIKNWNDVQRMAFDDQGRLTELFQTKAVGSITDTTHWLLTGQTVIAVGRDASKRSWLVLFWNGIMPRSQASSGRWNARWCDSSRMETSP